MDGVTKYNMTENYKKCLQKGLEFQDYITDILIQKLGISLSTYCSSKYQNISGENKQGFEIKFDDVYIKTGNIYIEVKEKSDANNLNYVDSGIYRNDNTWLYLIGNYTEVYIFSKKHLKLMHITRKYKEVKTPTSIGFLIPKEDCIKYCIYKIDT
jgi:hypothetical protein